jgi:hypothetical protein
VVDASFKHRNFIVSTICCSPCQNDVVKIHHLPVVHTYNLSYLGDLEQEVTVQGQPREKVHETASPPIARHSLHTQVCKGDRDQEEVQVSLRQKQSSHSLHLPLFPHPT